MGWGGGVVEGVLLDFTALIKAVSPDLQKHQSYQRPLLFSLSALKLGFLPKKGISPNFHLLAAIIFFLAVVRIRF